MNAPWMLCLTGTAVLAALMASNGSWRRHPSLFVYLLLIVAQSLVCWALWDSHAYSTAYYSFNAAEQVTQLWIMIEISTKVTAAGRKSARLIRAGVLTVTSVSAIWVLSGVREASAFLARLDSAVSLAWAGSFVLVVAAILFAGVQFSHGARGIATGFLVELLTGNIAAWLYVHGVHSALISPLKILSYGACVIVWTVTLVTPRLYPYRSIKVMHPACLQTVKKGFLGQ